MESENNRVIPSLERAQIKSGQVSLSNLTGVVKVPNLHTLNSSKNYPGVKGVGPLTNNSQMTPVGISNSTGRHD